MKKRNTGIALNSKTNEEFAKEVTQVSEFCTNKLTRLVIEPGAGFQIFTNPDNLDKVETTPTVVDVEVHPNSTTFVYLFLNPGDVVKVSALQIKNVQTPVRFFNNALLLKKSDAPNRVVVGSDLDQVFEIPTNYIPTTKHEIGSKKFSSKSKESNKKFLKDLLGDALLTDFNDSSKLTIIVRDKLKSVASACYNSNLYQLMSYDLVLNQYHFKPLKVNSEVSDNEKENGLFIRHHMSKNQIQIYCNDWELAETLLKNIESSNLIRLDLINKNAYYIDKVNTTSINQVDYRIEPLLRELIK